MNDKKGHIKKELYSLIARQKELRTAVIKSGKVNDEDDIQSITMLLDCFFRYEESEESNSPNDEKISIITDIANAIFADKEYVRKIPGVCLAGANRFLEIVKQTVVMLNKRALDFFENGEYHASYNIAHQAYLILTNSRYAISELLISKFMLDSCHYAIASYHNLRITKRSSEASDLYKALKDIDITVYVIEVFEIILELAMRSQSDKWVKIYLAKYRDYSYYAYRIAWIKLGYSHLVLGQKTDAFWSYLKYISYNMPGGQTDWLTMYESGGFNYCKEECEALARWLCNNIEKEEVNRLIYFCTLFEEIALEYALRHDMAEVVFDIVENGYDHYLEMPTLYLLYKYNRHAFLWYTSDIKYLCHERLLEQFYHYRGINRESEFSKEMIALSRKLLAERDKTDISDHRNINERQIFKYRKDE